MPTLAFHLGPIQYDQPVWLLVGLACCALSVFIGRQSLSGLGTVSRRAALIIRLIVIMLLVSAVARPHWRKVARNVAVTAVLDQSESVPKEKQKQAEQFMDDAAKGAHPGDLLARLTAARNAYVQALPTDPDPSNKPSSIYIGATDGTNLAEAIRLAMAVMPADKANRLLLASDGNETTGDVLNAARAAKTAHVPIDVLPLPYRFENEVIVERLVAPSTARMGQNVNLRVLVNSRKPAAGRLTITVNGDPIDLDPDSPEMGQRVTLDAGTNALTVPISLPLAGPQRFEAVFEPEGNDQGKVDAIVQNNRSMAVTFVQSEGRVLVLAPTPDEVAPLVQAMTESKIATDVRPLEQAAALSLVELGAFDAVVIANASVDHFPIQQQEELKAYVHDLGGGLVMTGGPEAFGAGGWIGSPLADALPIKLDPPQKRQMPRGALVVLMHSCEMPQGNYWAKKTAEAAVNNLSRLDLAGVLEFSFSKGDTWVYPLSEVGNKSAVMRAINSLTYGDMPTFDNLLTMALTALQKADAGMKHVVILSDGDPRLANMGLLTQYQAAKITISTVMVYPHTRGAGGPDWQTMNTIAQRTGGKFYPIIDQGQFAQLPNIFIKEAQVVKRSLIWEGAPFIPAVSNAVSEPMRGLGNVPPIGGYVVAADREGLSMVTLRGKENDPILAHWQFGLGKSVTFTSDAGARWAKSWPDWSRYKAFWEQHVRWAMRPGGSADMRVVTEDLGEKTRVVVEALDAQGERLNFVRFNARVVGPEAEPQPLELRQVGPGRYEGVFDSAKAGFYVANFRYVTPGPEGAPPREGNLQAAVTRPFADEYRKLEDNTALLRLVAEATGGRVLDLGMDASKADLWSREGLKMPVATRPIWLAVSLLAIGLFLADVAVRRVRIDIPIIVGLFRRGLRRSTVKAGEQMGSLKEARERARAQVEARRAVTAAAAKVDQVMARAKFEVSAEELAASKTNAAVPTFTDDAPRIRPVPGAKAPGEEEAGLSRLKKAKERARGEFDEEEKL